MSEKMGNHKRSRVADDTPDVPPDLPLKKRNVECIAEKLANEQNEYSDANALREILEGADDVRMSCPSDSRCGQRACSQQSSRCAHRGRHSHRERREPSCECLHAPEHAPNGNESAQNNNNVNERLDKAETVLNNLQEDVKTIRKMVTDIWQFLNTPDVQQPPCERPSYLPINSPEEFLKIKFLSREKADELTEYFAYLGGEDLKKHVVHIIENLLSPEMCSKVTWSTRNHEYGFEDSRLYRVIKAALERNPKCKRVTRRAVQNAISHTLGNKRRGYINRIRRAENKIKKQNSSACSDSDDFVVYSDDDTS